MARVLFVARFPDGTHVVQDIPAGHPVQVGDEILPRWVVAKVNLSEQLVDGRVVQFEAIVMPIEADQFSAG